MSKRRKISSAQGIKVAICGLGFVGSTIAAVWLRAGATVIGFDRDSKVLDIAAHGETHTGEPGVGDAFASGLNEKRFRVTSDPVEAYKGSNVKIIAVDVGLDQGDAQLATLISALKDVGKNLVKGDTLIVKPTLPIGTSRRVIIPLVEEVSGLKVETDFFFVYSPERISSGQGISDVEENYPAVVSGAGPKSLAKGSELYRIISRKGVVKTSSLDAAEAEKIFEGVYRDVNIALANEMAKICSAAGINFWEIRAAANSQPYSHIHRAGIGVGGFCIPVYPHFLLRTAMEYDEEAPVTLLARNTNLSMPHYCVEKAFESAKAFKVKVKKVAVLGLAFRGDVPDKRLSPTYDIIRELKKHKVQVSVHDPYISHDKDLPNDVTLTNNFDEAIRGSDIVILCTDHKQYKELSDESFAKIGRKNSLIFDGRAILDKKRFKKLHLITLGVKDELTNRYSKK
ncbi:MAG TPA: nucleotide sugar dehydrogenase [Nitrososphaerales archaeon]